jgi:ankyrin repeat protein
VDEEQKKQELQNVLAVIALIIARGGDLAALNEQKQTPFMLALEEDCADLLGSLSDRVKLSDQPRILHIFSRKLFDDRYRSILLSLLDKEVTMDSSVINVLDENGFTPFLAFIDCYIKAIPEFAEKVTVAIQW